MLCDVIHCTKGILSLATVVHVHFYGYICTGFSQFVTGLQKQYIGYYPFIDQSLSFYFPRQFQAPIINNETMTPVTQYSLQYYPTSSGSSNGDPETMPADNPNFFLYGLSLGTEYTFRAVAISLGGNSEPLEAQYVVGESNNNNNITIISYNNDKSYC